LRSLRATRNTAFGNAFYSECQRKVQQMSIKNTALGNQKHSIWQQLCSVWYEPQKTIVLFFCRIYVGVIFGFTWQKKRTKRKCLQASHWFVRIELFTQFSIRQYQC